MKISGRGETDQAVSVIENRDVPDFKCSDPLLFSLGLASTVGLGPAFRLILGLNERLPECHGLRDASDRCLGIACACNDQGAEIEHTTKDLLIDLDTLDLADVYLDCSPTDETMLDDYSLGSNCELSSLVPHIGHGPKDETDAEGWKQHEPEGNEVPKGPQADMSQVNDLLVLDQRTFNIARHAVSKADFDGAV